MKFTVPHGIANRHIWLLALTLALSAMSTTFAHSQPIEAVTENAETESQSARKLLDDQRVIRLNDEGNRLHAIGEYRKALEHFLQAHAINGDPNLLFNIANCYERMGDRLAAAEKYEAFLGHPGTDPQGRTRAKRLLGELRSEPTPQAATKASSALSESENVFGNWIINRLPIATLGAGAAFAVAGAVLYGLGLEDHNRLETSRGYGNAEQVSELTRFEAQTLRNDGTRRKNLGATGLALGSGLLATYFAVFVLGDRQEPNQLPPNGDSAVTANPPLGLAFAPAVDGAQLHWKGQF